MSTTRSTFATALGLLLLLMTNAPPVAANQVQHVADINGTYLVVEASASWDAGAYATAQADGAQACATGSPDCKVTPFHGLAEGEVVIDLWEESNGCEGLQREPTDCDPDREGTEPADEPVR